MNPPDGQLCQASTLSWTTRFDSIGFCESKAFPLLESEYLNAFSSIPITLIAFAGPGSFMFHWTLQYGWRLGDEYPMIMAVFLGNFLLYDDILHRYFAVTLKDHNKYHNSSIILSMVLMFSCVYIMILDAIPQHQEAFATIFGLVALCLAPPILIVIHILSKFAKAEFRDPSGKLKLPRSYSAHEADKLTKATLTVVKYLITALIIIFIGILCWVIPENLCRLRPDLAPHLWWFHSIWHICMAYGLFVVCQAALFFHIIQIKGTATIRKKSNWIWVNDNFPTLVNLYFSIFVIVRLDSSKVFYPVSPSLTPSLTPIARLSRNISVTDLNMDVY